MSSVNSVVRTFMILDLIANSKEHLTSSEISSRLQIPSSTTHDILMTLLEENIIYYKDFNRKTFAIGIRIFALSKGYIFDSNIINISKSFVTNFADKYRISGFVLKPIHDSMIITYRYESEYSLLKVPNIGHEFPRRIYEERKVYYRRNEMCPEIMSISIPLYDYSESAIGELYFTGLANELLVYKEHIEEELLEMSYKISEKLGSKNK